MSVNGSVAHMVDVILSRQATARAGQSGETFADAMVAVLGTEAGRQLEELRIGQHANEWAHRWQEELAPKRATSRKRVRRQEGEQASRDADWELFVQTEELEMELRKDGQLAGALDRMRGSTPTTLPVALPPALRRLASEDRRQAEEGLVALMRGGKVSYKRLDALTQKDVPARVAANRARTTWLKERRDGWISTRQSLSVG